MSDRAEIRSARRQSGLALLVVIAVVALGGTLLALRSFNAASQRADRYRVTQEALIKAKEALIAYAVSDATRPGELPCPDVNDDGKLVLGEDFVGSNCVSLIGRVPWITLRLPDLRDAAGERLWYALSNDFHANGSVALNSDTAYRTGNTSLTIAGTQPANNVVAIVFSAGAALKRAGGPANQDRSCIVGTNCDAAGKCTTSPATNTPKCNPLNYLDITSGVDNADANTTFISAAESDAFNDRMLAILSDDIMSLVEKRAGREYAQRLREHFDSWQTAAGKGFYPWATPFNDPSLLMQPGTSPTVQGLLPSAQAPLVWTAASPGCVGVGTKEITCTAGSVDPPLIPLFNVTGSVGNIATSFYGAPSAGDVSVDPGLILLGAPTATWSVNTATEALNFSYNAAGVGVGVVVIRVRAPVASAWTATSWLISNRWYQTAFYAFSSGYAVNVAGAGACGGAAPPCLSVGNTLAPNNDKQAVVITTGRALPGKSPRPVAPPAAIDDFLEGDNQTPADLAFENNLRNSAFNDQPVIVRP